MIVTSNSSPLIGLARIGQIDILQKCFRKIIIPQAVWHEVVVEGDKRPGVQELASAAWLQTVAVNNRTLVWSLRQSLGVGESESIALSIELHADLLLMDEKLGRETARFFDVPHIGLVGVLLFAKRTDHIVNVKSLLDQLRGLATFRISDALYEKALRDAGEWQG